MHTDTVSAQLYRLNLLLRARVVEAELRGWYMMKLEAYDWRSPRNYLRGMSWEERTRVGRDALIKFGVMKP